jgi:hypothetical protein
MLMYTCLREPYFSKKSGVAKPGISAFSIPSVHYQTAPASVTTVISFKDRKIPFLTK